MGEHDTLFKRTFGVPRHAAGLIRSLLPAAVTHRLDFDRLELMPGSFVDEEMAQSHGDLLFRVPIVGEDAFLYILLEHQSGPDDLMPFRISTYRHGACTSLLRREPERRTLPIVVGIVIHHGSQGWTSPRSLGEMLDGFDTLPGLGPVVPDFDLIIDDLVHVDDEALLARPMSAFPKLVLWARRDGRSPEKLFRSLPRWRHELERLMTEDPSLRDAGVVLRYILRVSGDVPFEIIRQEFIKVIPEIEVAMASAAEQLFQEGIEKGIEKGIEQGEERGLKKGRQEGRQEGRQAGRQEANRTMLGRLLQLRFGALGPEVEARIAEGSSEQVEGWLERFATAETLDGIFAD